MTLHTINGTLHPTAPFDFDKTLAFLGMFKPAMGTQQIDSHTLTKAISINGQPVVFRLTSRGSVDQPALTYTLYAEQSMDESTHVAAVDRIRYFLSLDDDLRPFYALAHDDELFTPVLRDLYGYHQVKFPSAFENAVWAVISQRNLMTVSQKMKTALTERYGSQLTVEGSTHIAFPDAERLVLVSPDELAGVIGHAPKAGTLIGAARAFASVDEHWLRDAPLEQVEAWLRSIRGVGAWTASFVLLRGLGRMEVIPTGEKRLLTAAARVYGLVSATDDDLRRLGARYGEHIGYWAHYLRVGA